MKTSRSYTRELYKQFKYLATWLPGVPLALGDIGLMKGKEFTKIGNLSDKKFNIKFDIENDTTKSEIEHSSKGAVTLSIKASGATPSQGSTLGKVDAGATIEFSKENAVLFKANGTLNHTIKDQISLGSQILNLYKNGQWDKDYVIITELVVADSSTILISSSKKGKIELKAKSKITSGNIDIADASFGFTNTFTKDLSTKIIAKEGLTPLFKVSKVRSRFLQPSIFSMNKVYSEKMLNKNYSVLNNELLYFGELEFEDFFEE